jgi:hypothetical protein
VCAHGDAADLGVIVTESNAGTTSIGIDELDAGGFKSTPNRKVVCDSQRVNFPDLSAADRVYTKC